MSQWTFCHTHCLFWISKHCNRLGYSANATCSAVSHNIWIHHLTNCGSVTIKSGSGEPAETPERGLSGQEEEAAWLSMPEIIISIIFCNFQHLNRAKPSQETKQRPARLRLPPEKAHSEACESLPAERGCHLKTASAAGGSSKRRAFNARARSRRLLRLNVWNQTLAKNYNYRWYTDWNHRGCFLFFFLLRKIVLMSSLAICGVEGREGLVPLLEETVKVFSPPVCVSVGEVLVYSGGVEMVVVGA